YLV
ncbi:hypothetical protein MK338_03525, partial [Streptococcus vestibularis]